MSEIIPGRTVRVLEEGDKNVLDYIGTFVGWGLRASSYTTISSSSSVTQYINETAAIILTASGRVELVAVSRLRFV